MPRSITLRAIKILVLPDGIRRDMDLTVSFSYGFMNVYCGAAVLLAQKF